MVLATLSNVRFTYAFHEHLALDEVTVELEEGRLYGVVGLNGSGKSTLCALLRGVIPHFHSGELSGDVQVLGRDIRDWDPAELSTRIGYVFQNPHTQISGVKPTVFEEIAFGLENLGVARDEIFDRVAQVITQLGLRAIADKDPNELSGGQCQKVAFASILAMDPDVYVIDEPTSQLDPESSGEVFDIIDRLKSAGRSIVLVEHKVDLLAEYADNIIVMNEGRIALSGDTYSVLTSPLLAEASVRPPDVLDLARLLELQGKHLSGLPITRAEAMPIVAARLEGADDAHCA